MAEILLTIGAVLLLIAGAIYPMLAIYGLVSNLNRTTPSPSPLAVMLRLFLIATVPLAGILGGFAGLLPSVWESFVLRVVIIAASVASIAGFIALAIVSKTEGRNAVAEPTRGKGEEH